MAHAEDDEEVGRATARSAAQWPTRSAAQWPTRSAAQSSVSRDQALSLDRGRAPGQDEALSSESLSAAGAEPSAAAQGRREALPRSIDGDVELPQPQYQTAVRVLTGWQWRERHRSGEPADSQQDFFLAQARLAVSAQVGKVLRAKVGLDVSDGLSLNPDETAFVRDAWVRYRAFKGLSLRVGRFKRPLSRVELVGGASLPFRGRGPSNGLIIEDQAYGGRALGAELSGELKFGGPLGVAWWLTASAPESDAKATDVHARTVFRLGKILELGFAAAQKLEEDPNADGNRSPPLLGGVALGVDAELDWRGWNLLVDVLTAEELRFGNGADVDYSVRPRSFGATGYVTYRHPIGDEWALAPVVAVDWTDRDLAVAESEVVRAVVGINALWFGERLRLMPHIEWIRPRGRNAELEWDKRETYLLFISSEIE